jgi:hypothetical protein
MKCVFYFRFQWIYKMPFIDKYSVVYFLILHPILIHFCCCKMLILMSNLWANTENELFKPWSGHTENELFKPWSGHTPKTIKLIFAASLLRTQYWGVQTG